MQNLGQKRILVVDDEPVIRDILRDFLEFEDFYVVAVGSGESAINCLVENEFDLVLTDLKMGGMSGLDLLRRVNDLGRDTAVVLMTGFGTVETAIEAMKQGAFDYVLKPFKPEDVVAVLRRALEKQHLERENTVLRETLSYYELSEALSSAMPLDDQLEHIVTAVRRNLGADAVTIVTQNPENSNLYTVRAGEAPFEDGLKHKSLHGQMVAGDRVVLEGDALTQYFDRTKSAEHQMVGFMSAPLKIRGAPFGFINAYSCTHGQRFTEGQRKGLSVFGTRAAQAIETARMYGNLQENFTQTIEGFARALEEKDAYTKGHSDRVAMYSRMIAETMNLPQPEIDRVEHGGLMHDIGKMGIRSGDLNKAQRLTAKEYELFKTHPVKGAKIIKPISFLVYVVPCIYYHHESWNGRGYPEGLDGEGIPLEARILAVADSYDAMTSNRPYRKALPHAIAAEELTRCASTQFDPQVVEPFLEAIEPWRQKRKEQGKPYPL